MHGKPMRQRALTEIVLEQERLACIKFLQRGNDLVQFGVHLAPDIRIRIHNVIRHCEERSDEAIQSFMTLDCFVELSSGRVMTRPVGSQ